MKKIKTASGNTMLFRWSLREIWQGQLWPVVAALTLIVACVVALSALAIRVEKVMTAQGRTMMAADLVFRSANPAPQWLIEDAHTLGLTVSVQTRFQTMAFSDNDMQLVSVRSVETSYPLRGEFNLVGQGGKVSHSVLPGELWISARLFSLLQVGIGDRLAIGDAELTVAGSIAAQPELTFNPFRTMPSVFIHQSDLPKTGAIQLGSRVQHRIFFNGEESALNKLQRGHQLQPSERWISEDNQGRTADLIKKAKQYLSLTIVMVILMAAVTLVLTCQHYASSRTDTVAMLKSMGASKKWLRRWLLAQVSLMFAAALLFGSLLGLGLELLLRLPLQDILPAQLPGYGYLPFVAATLVALLIGLPALGIPLIRLLDTSAVAVLQAQAVAPSKKGWWLAGLPVLAFMLFYGGNALVWMVLGGLIMLFVLLAGSSYSLLSLLQKQRWGPAMTLALSRIRRSKKGSIMQLAALSGSLMLVTVIWLLRSDLLVDWQKSLPADAANVFALNIAPTQRLEYLQKLDANNIERSQAYAIIRGRVTQINGLNIKEVITQEKQNLNVLHREINFTWAEQLPVYNELLAGQWTATKGVSVEQSVAQDLGIEVGDSLSFSINSQSVSATVNSIRSVQWQSMKPNFYFIFTPDLIANLPATWLLSFRISEQQIPLLNQLGRDYPTVSLLDFRIVGEKIQHLLMQIVWSLTVLAGLGVVSGILLIFTLLRLSLTQRQREITLYRTLGASRKRISQTLWSEYGVMAIAAGFVAAVGAELVVFSLIKWGFKLTPSLHLGIWFVLPLLAALLVFASLISAIKGLLKPLK
ncbi:MAG: putative ABC transport system permease protein [Psychromonas sp.]|jgi:putative ABC transport system permease protein|uniref:ABC transporter permease n=1 Tax=Psychromonas sp. TaxID=1884585 RepID=UPI0039E32DF6